MKVKLKKFADRKEKTWHPHKNANDSIYLRVILWSTYNQVLRM